VNFDSSTLSSDFINAKWDYVCKAFEAFETGAGNEGLVLLGAVFEGKVFSPDVALGIGRCHVSKEKAQVSSICSP